MAQQEMLKLLAEAENGVFVVDLKQRVTLWNRGAEHILGYGGANVLGRPCYAVCGGTSAEGTRVCKADCPTVIRARQDAIPAAHTLLARCKDGRQKWISVTHVVVPESEPGGNVLAHIFHDVTDHMEAKQVIQRLGSLLGATPLAPPAPDTSGTQTPYGLLALTPRERQILRLLAQGMPTGAISRTLVITPTTVRNHTKHILAKLGAHSRLEALAAVYGGAAL